MFSRAINPKRKGRGWLTALATLSIVTGTLVFASTALSLTQGEFELDKNATNDLTTEHLGTIKSSVNSTATSMVVCERQFDITDDNVDNPIVVPIPAVPFTIQLDAEQMTVTALTGASNKTGGCGFSDPADSTAQIETWTVTRHVNGTTAASHSGNSDVTHILTGATPGDDWDQVYASVTADPDDIGDDDKCIALGAVECAWIHDGFDITVFTTGGSKDDLNINPLAGEAGGGWKWTDSSVPPSDEILDAFAAKYSNGRQLLFFGADRWATVGAKDFGFWFFHDQVGLNPDGTFSGNHTAPTATSRGDILMLGTFSQGGAVTTLRVFEWVGTGGDTNGTLDSLGTFGDCGAGGGSAEGCNTVNNTVVPSPWDYEGAASGAAADTFYAGALMEGGIDLTELGLEGCFASFMAETRSSPEPGAQLKDFVLGNFEACESSLVTTPKDGTGEDLTPDSDSDGLDEITIGTGAAGVDVTDSAVLSVTGTNTFSGTLSFFICGPIADPDTCDTGGVPAGSQTVTTGGTYSSDSANLTQVGRYCWRGFFDSDTPGVDDATDASEGECFEVLPVQPTISTDATDAVEIGDPISDTATLGGTAYQPGTDGADATYPSIDATMDTPAGGSIDFNLYGPNDATCAGTATLVSTETVSGDGPYTSDDSTPSATGTYNWIASYSGNDPNTLSVSGSCGDANETSKVVDAKISIAPDETNEITVHHTFTVTVQQDAGDGSGFVNVPDGTLVAVTLTDANGAVNSVDSDVCGTTGTTSGECTIEFHSDTTGTVTGHASVTLSVEGVSLTRETDSVAPNSGDAVKTYVDAQIDVSPLEATNEVNDPHEVTATVQQDPGTGVFENAPDGTEVTFSLLNNTAGAAFVGGVNTCTTTSGSCSVSINTSTAGTVDIHATTTFLVGGVSLTRATDGLGNNSNDANKVYVDAYITINPPLETNSVGDPHTFTVAVFQDDGLPASDGDGVNGPAPAPDGTIVTVTLTDTLGAVSNVSSDTCASPGTSGGTCTVTFTSPTAGTVTGHAEVTFDVGGVSLFRETDGNAPNSGDAVKHFIAGSIAWSKVDNANELQGGATFRVCQTHTYDLETDFLVDLDPDVCVDIEDNVSPDADADDGEFLYGGLSLGRYTVKEIVAPPGFVADPDTEIVVLAPGDTEQTIGESFVNSRPILKISGFGYTNEATGTPTSGVVSGTATYTVNLHNYGTASALLTNSSLVASVTGAGSGTLTCDASGTDGLDLAITGSIAAGGDGGPYILTCTYSGMDDGAVIAADLVVNYTTNGLERSASGSPAKITFTVQAD